MVALAIVAALTAGCDGSNDDSGGATATVVTTGPTRTGTALTLGREVRKDVFFFSKADWTQTPVTCSAERRRTDHVRTATVKVCSNATSTTLHDNGVEVARRRSPTWISSRPRARRGPRRPAPSPRPWPMAG